MKASERNRYDIHSPDFDNVKIRIRKDEFIMSKKVLCTLLVAAMAASVFASCGSSGGSSSKPDSSSKADTSASESGSSEASSEESSSAAYVPNFDEAPYTVHFQYCVAAEGSGQTGVNEAVDELAM